MVGSWAAAAISTEPESCERFLGGTTAPDDSFCPNAVLSSNRQRAEFNTSHGIVPALGSMHRDTRIQLTNQIEKVKLNLVHTADPEFQLRHIFRVSYNEANALVPSQSFYKKINYLERTAACTCGGHPVYRYFPRYWHLWPFDICQSHLQGAVRSASELASHYENVK